MQKISWWRTSIGREEVERMIDSISKEHISQGPVVAALEEQIATAMDVPYVVITTSGSVALLMAAMTLDIGPGDEVIVPNRTWIATAHAPLILGAKVILVDVLPDIPVMDISQVRNKITSRTKAIMPVHLNGRANDMDGIHDIAKEYGLSVIEDAAQAMFSKNSAGFLGTQSDIGCFSLGLAKLIATGQGGFAVTRSAEIYEKLKIVRNHGLLDNFSPNFIRIGCNFRTTDILASIGIEQLKRVESRIAHINAIYCKYAEAIKELPFLNLIPVKVQEGEVPIYAEVLCSERDKLAEFLRLRGIETRPFLPDLSEAPYIESDERFSRSEVFRTQGMTLPCGPEQPLENIEYTIDALINFDF